MKNKSLFFATVRFYDDSYGPSSPPFLALQEPGPLEQARGENPRCGLLILLRGTDPGGGRKC